MLNRKGMTRLLFLVVLQLVLFATTSLASDIERNKVIVEMPDGLLIEVKTSETKVRAILEEKDIDLQEDEFTEPSVNLDSSNTIKIKKKGEFYKLTDSTPLLENEIPGLAYGKLHTGKVIIEKELPFEVIDKAKGADLSKGKKLVVQEGKPGLMQTKYRSLYHNGEEVLRIEYSSAVVEEPKDEIIEFKENPKPKIVKEEKPAKEKPVEKKTVENVPKTSNESGLAAEAAKRKGQSLTVNASGYCPCMTCNGRTDAKTASGKIAQVYYTLAAPPEYPFGTIFYLEYFKDTPSKGWYIVQDRGGAIKGNKVDVFFGSHGEALNFGRRDLKAVVYLP